MPGKIREFRVKSRHPVKRNLSSPQKVNKIVCSVKIRILIYRLEIIFKSLRVIIFGKEIERTHCDKHL